MAGKGGGKNRKSPKKLKLDIERFAYDILSFILPLGGFPKEKIKQKEGKQNVYKDSNHVSIFGAAVMCVALNHRDQWKTMFESRFKSSGLDTNEKVEKYLGTFLAIEREFQQSVTPVKVQVSLAAYSEMMLFLTYKGVEFDFERMLTSWSRCFKQFTSQHRNTDELLNHLFTVVSDPFEYIEWITIFMQDVASPYGKRDDISALFSCISDNESRKKDEKDNELVEVVKLLANQASSSEKPVLPPGFESSAVLPGDRESSEAQSSPERGAVGGSKKGEKKQRRGRTRSTNVRQSKTEERQRSKTLSELEIMDRLGQLSLSREMNPQKNRSEIPERTNPKKIEFVEPVFPPGFESSAVLPGDRESPEPPLSPEKSAVEGRKRYRRTRFGTTPSTNVGKSRTEEREKSKTLSELEIMDRLGQLSLCSETSSQENRGAVPKRRNPKKRDSC